MPYLVDGNNVIHALAADGVDVGRQSLCRLLAALQKQGQNVRVVFDGPPPPPGLARQIDETGVAVDYAEARSADELIVEHINADSAPRRLTVVSTDRELRKAARRRRCGHITSEDFARMLVEIDQRRRSAAATRPPEPKEKRHGLTEEQTRWWLREFGFDD